MRSPLDRKQDLDVRHRSPYRATDPMIEAIKKRARKGRKRIANAFAGGYASFTTARGTPVTKLKRR